MGERDRPLDWMKSASWESGCGGGGGVIVGCRSPRSLCAKKSVAPPWWTGLGSPNPAFGRVALACGACAWFGADLADTDPKEAGLFEVFAVDA